MPDIDLPLVTPSQRDSEVPCSPITSLELECAKRAYTTRSIDIGRAGTLLCGDHRPENGDLVLAEVVNIGQHPRIELATGRRARLYIGDRVLVCYSARYAPDQFEARVPLNLEKCHLVAAGGIAAEMLTRHQNMKPATYLHPLGLVADQDGQRINLRDSRLACGVITQNRPMTVAVAGTAMNAGKTTTAAHLIKGLDRAGLKVAAAKITGTGSGGDYWFMLDSGANPVLDFTQAGYASTYGLAKNDLENILETLVAELARHQPDVIVLEIADGIFQEETAAILGSALFRRLVDRLIFAACDATGALTGKLWLEHHQLPVIAISGMLTASPLAIRETEHATGMLVFDKEQLADPDIAQQLLKQDGLLSQQVLAG